MGANSSHPATTSPIPEYRHRGGPPQQYGGHQVQYDQQQQYRAQPYGGPEVEYKPPYYRSANPLDQDFDPFQQSYGGAIPRIGDANAYYADGPPSRGPPRGPARGPGGPRGPLGGPPRAPGGNNYPRSNRPLPPVVSNALDDDDIFAVEQDLFRSRPPKQKQNPFGDFDPFENYNRRRADPGPTYDGQQISYGGGNQGVRPQRAQEYRSPPPQPQYFHVQPPPGQDSSHVFHYDPTTGTLATNDGHSRVTQLPHGFGYSGGNPQVIGGGQGFPFSQGY